MKRIRMMMILATMILSGIFAFTALADQPATPTDLPAITEQEAPAETETEEADPEQTGSEQEIPEADEPELSTETAQEQPTEAGAEQPAEAEPELQAETAQEETAENAAEPETTEPADPDQAMLEAGYIQVMVIRENGTGLYDRMDETAAAVGSLQHKDVVWVRPMEGIWAEVLQEDENAEPVYLNLNNVLLLQGEIGDDIPIRTVKLTSTLDGLTEIEEGTEVTITAEYSGFPEDEIVNISWQYRGEDDPDGDFHDIEGVTGFTYSYTINGENAHNEWRIALTLKR